MEKNRSPLINILPNKRNAKKPIKKIVGKDSTVKNPRKTRTRNYNPSMK